MFAPSKIFTFLLLLSPLFAVISPRFLAYWPVIIALIAYVQMYFYDRARLKEFINVKYLFIILSISILLFGSSLWSVDSFYVLDRAFGVFVILFGGFLLWNASGFVYSGTRNKENFLKYYPLVVFGFCVVAFVDIISGFPLYKILHGMSMDEVVNPSRMNRSLVGLMIMSVPALFICSDKRNYMVLIALLLSLFSLLMVTQSQSFQMAFIVGMLIAFMPLGYKFVRHFMVFIVLALVFVSPWMVIWMFSNMTDILMQYDFFQSGYAGHRLEIWDFVSDYAITNPLYGYGLEATRLVQDFNTDMIYFKGSGVLHPHNFALQIWIEFGLIGVLCFSAFVLFIFREVGFLSKNNIKASLVLFFVIISVGATGYGMWQSWWIGVIVLSVAISYISRIDANKS